MSAANRDLLPNKPLQLTALRAAAERSSVGQRRERRKSASHDQAVRTTRPRSKTGLTCVRASQNDSARREREVADPCRGQRGAGCRRGVVRPRAARAPVRSPGAATSTHARTPRGCGAPFFLRQNASASSSEMFSLAAATSMTRRAGAPRARHDSDSRRGSAAPHARTDAHDRSRVPERARAIRTPHRAVRGPRESSPLARDGATDNHDLDQRQRRGAAYSSHR